MLDDGDEEFVLWAFWPESPLGVAVWLIALIVIGVAVMHNKEECAQLSCGNGQVAQLLNHQCLCVTKPGEPQVQVAPETTELTPLVIGDDVTATESE